MPKVRVSIMYPVYVDLDIDYDQVNDDDYIMSKQSEAKDIADKIMEATPPNPFVHDCDIQAMIE